MARRRTDLAAAKQRRQKTIAIVGAVLLAALLAVQVPRTMRMLDDGGAEGEPAAAPEVRVEKPTAGEPPAATTEARAPAAPAAQLVASGSSPAPEEGDLTSFERFSSKDPFAQQLSAAPVPTATPTAAPSPASAPAPVPAPATPPPPPPTEAAGGGSSEASVSGAPTAATPNGGPEGGEAAKRPSAVISVNGTRETVAVGRAFPKGAPTFRLVAVGADWAKIGIAGGTFTSGAKTITLKKGKTVKLLNTADGGRYELRLVSVA